MQDYNFWADLLLTFKSSPDWIKALWLLVPPMFVLAVMGMVMRFGLALRPRPKPVEGELIVPLRHRGGALEDVDFAALPREIEVTVGMLPTPLCTVGHLPHKGGDRLE